MSVMLPNASLSVRRAADVVARDAHGDRIPAGWGTVETLQPGRVNERADGGFDLGLDPSLWPVRQGDLVVDDTGNEWLVNTADLLTNSYDDYVDWVRVDARERVTGGTEPGGAWFVARRGDEAGGG